VAVRDYELARTEASERQGTRDGRAEQTPGRRKTLEGARLRGFTPGDAPPAPLLGARRDTIRISGGADAAAAPDGTGGTEPWR